MSLPPLTRMEGTQALYQGDKLFFLLADAAGAPASLPLDGTWGPPPATVGHYLFVAGEIAAPAAFETALRALLPPPAASSVAWVTAAAGGPALACRVESAANGTVAAEVVVTVGATQLVLPAGTPLIPWRDAVGDLLGFTSAAPPVPGGGTPNAQGTRVAFSGAAAGCLCFNGLFNLSSTPVSATTQVVDVQLDPLRPGDPSRTRITFTDRVISLVPHGSGFRLQRDA